MSYERQLVWFLAPTVTLCEQQFEVFKSNLPGYGIQVLSGRDDVDHWTEQSIWDAVLHNVRIVLSTHQVLLDALTHAFVKMSQLALIIFDEGVDLIRHWMYQELNSVSAPLHLEAPRKPDYVAFLYASCTES